MSCSGCRVLRKGCSDACVLRASIAWIDGAEAQAHATVFVAKFFGRASFISSLSSTSDSHRPARFRSLLYEACGRAVNPITGAVGLLWSGNWDVCESAVQTILHGGIPRPLMNFEFNADELYKLNEKKRKRSLASRSDTDLCLSGEGRVFMRQGEPLSDESVMTSDESSGGSDMFGMDQTPQLLNLLV